MDMHTYCVAGNLGGGGDFLVELRARSRNILPMNEAIIDHACTLTCSAITANQQPENNMKNDHEMVDYIPLLYTCICNSYNTGMRDFCMHGVYCIEA